MLCNEQNMNKWNCPTIIACNVIYTHSLKKKWHTLIQCIVLAFLNNGDMRDENAVQYIVHCYFFIRQENQYSVCLMTKCADPGNISEWEVGGVRWVILFSKVWGLFRKFNYLILLFWLFQGAEDTPFYLRIRTWMGMIFLIDKTTNYIKHTFLQIFYLQVEKGLFKCYPKWLHK